MEVHEIIKTWLEENGYDGLCDPDTECGCELSDLMPCSEGWEHCQAGHKKDDGLIYPGKAQPEDLEDKCFNTGCIDYMEKAIYVVIDEHRPPRIEFIEIEMEGGKSIKIGERVALPDLLTAIKITSTDIESVYSS